MVLSEKASKDANAEQFSVPFVALRGDVMAFNGVGSGVAAVGFAARAELGL